VVLGHLDSTQNRKVVQVSKNHPKWSGFSDNHAVFALGQSCPRMSKKSKKSEGQMVSMTDLWIEELRRCGDWERRAQLVKEVKKDIAELVAWMDRAWVWLDRNQGAERFGEKEDRLIERIGLYERAVDAVRREEQEAA
jgi:hypothetical protein